MQTSREEPLPRLDNDAADWLDRALTEARAAAAGEDGSPAGTAAPRRRVPAWELRFAAAGRACKDPGTAEAARVLLLHTARPGAEALTTLYRRGTAAERRAVLLALPRLAVGPATALALVEDALRTNDVRLLAAAVGPCAADLGAHAWRHAVLKCLFTGVPTAAVAGLAARAAGDAELARMLRDFAAERTAAGRPVPDDLPHVLALTAKEA